MGGAGRMIAVLATCFNRRDVTVRGLQSLRAAALGLDYHVYLMDDGSTDGTGQAIREAFPEVSVYQGDGSLYWNGGMRAAWRQALESGADYYLLWNDDLDLLPGSLTKLMELQQQQEAINGPKVISVGKVTDPETGAVTYGGYVRAPGFSRLKFSRADGPEDACVTMNGNCVLIPSRAVDDVGILSEHYTHDTGDIDYGLRASKAGYRIIQSAFSVGRTPFNDAFLKNMSRLTWSNRNFILKHPKGIPVKEWMHFCRTHGGWMWPVNFFGRYLKIIRLA